MTIKPIINQKSGNDEKKDVSFHFKHIFNALCNNLS